MTGSTRVDSMTAALVAFEGLAERQRSEKLAAKERFFAAFAAKRQELPAAGGQHFNTLRLCGVGTDEVRHSAILAWLLDERSGHGQGSLFLRTLLGLVGGAVSHEALSPYRV